MSLASSSPVASITTHNSLSGTLAMRFINFLDVSTRQEYIVTNVGGGGLGGLWPVYGGGGGRGDGWGMTAWGDRGGVGGGGTGGCV